MAQSCPNCGIPCTGCAGARIIQASDGKTVCTKCINAYELKIKGNLPGRPNSHNTQVGKPTILSITHNFL